MKPAFTFEEIREAEKSIVGNDNVPSLILMENAGRNSFQVLFEEMADLDDRNIFIICGKGNNAGDGFVLARQLLINGYDIKVVLLEKQSSFRGDALLNYHLLEKCANDNPGFISFAEFSSQIKNSKRTLIIDAILGTGIKGSLQKSYESAIVLINNLKNTLKNIKIISLDVPSGLMSGKRVNPVISADMTITMGAVKTELLFGEGKQNCGRVIVVPIGITYELISKNNTSGKYFTGLNDARLLLPKRKKASYKYANGKVLVIGGSKGISGSIMMSSYSAVKAGAGGVAAAIPKSIAWSFNKKLYEIMTVELDETEEGSINSDSFGRIKKRMDWADGVLLGPGISTNDSVKEFVFDVIKNCDKPLVIDADGLNLLSNDISVLNNRKFKNEIILTPHLGEFSALSGIPVKEIELNRFNCALDFAKKYNVNLVIKSETTFSCTPAGKIYINSSGNEALGTAGTGDVLSGIIVSILAQTGSAESAMICGNYIHGLSADIYFQKYGNKQSASPKDIIKYIPKAISGILR